MEHLRDAVRLNRQRRAGYVAAGGWRAALLSRALVAAELALLPAGWLVDRQARPFVEVGVPILVGDLAGFENLPPPNAPVPAVLHPLGAWDALARWLDVVRGRMSLGALAATADAGGLYLTAHLAESAEAMSAHGAEYVRQVPATADLTRRLVLGHLALVPLAVALDRAAAALHRRGVGLFVNDLPPVPVDA